MRSSHPIILLATFALTLSANETQASVKKVVNTLFDSKVITSVSRNDPSRNNTIQIPVIVAIPNTIVVYGDWLDITSEAYVTIDGSNQPIAFVTGKTLQGDPYVKLTVPRNVPFGQYFIRMGRPLGEDYIGIRVVNDPHIADVEVISLRTNNIAYENAFPMNTDFLIRVTGTHLEEITVIPSANMQIRPNGGVTATKREYIASMTAVTDSLTIDENSFKFLPSECNYSALKTHPVNNAPFTYLRIYDKPQFSVRDVQNKFNVTTQSCPSLLSVRKDASSAMALADPAFNIQRFSMPAPTATSPSVVKEVTWPDIRIVLRNDSWAPAPAFTAEMRLGNTVQGTIAVPAMLGKTTATIIFHRPLESRKLLGRHFSCPDIYELKVAPYDWVDGRLTLALDPSNSFVKAGNTIYSF